MKMIRISALRIPPKKIFEVRNQRLQALIKANDQDFSIYTTEAGTGIDLKLQEKGYTPRE